MNPASETESIDWESTVIVGEYTVPSGPYFDDHFLVIVLRSGRMLECTVGNAKNVISDLERAVGTKIVFQLCNRTDATSRVLYPSAFAEHPLFDFYREPNGFYRFFKAVRYFGVTEISKRLTRELAEYIRSLG